MRQNKALHALTAGSVVVLIASVAALATVPPPPPPPPPPGQLDVYLVRQDFSDCQNANVPSGNGPLVSGIVWLSRGNDGNTTVKVSLTASPDTTYHFYLKCVRQLGDIATGDEGVGEAVFTFATNSVGNVYAFDSYPEGAPAGNKFQSAQVKWQ